MPKKTKTSRPFTLRLTEKERSELERRSGSKSLGAYIRTCLFKTSASKANRSDVASLLRWLGKSDIAANVRELAQAARSGSMPVSPETSVELDKACQDILAIKSMLMKALGIKER
ncbi:MAG: hypothetical protein ACRBBN_21760 [Methyloligellaceae bacterium]